MTIDEVCDVYLQCESMKETARRLHISEGVVRKCLISEGIIDSPLIRQISALRKTGASIQDVAEALELSASWVNANSPYERGMMITPSQTVNANRIRACRAKKKECMEEIPEDVNAAAFGQTHIGGCNEKNYKR